MTGKPTQTSIAMFRSGFDPTTWRQSVSASSRWVSRTEFPTSSSTLRPTRCAGDTSTSEKTPRPVFSAAAGPPPAGTVRNARFILRARRCPISPVCWGCPTVAPTGVPGPSPPGAGIASARLRRTCGNFTYRRTTPTAPPCGGASTLMSGCAPHTRGFPTGRVRWPISRNLTRWTLDSRGPSGWSRRTTARYARTFGQRQLPDSVGAAAQALMAEMSESPTDDEPPY